MRLASLASRKIVLELDPEDCLCLARACDAAAHALSASVVTRDVFGLPNDAPMEQPALMRHYEALAVAFEGAAVAGHAQFYVGVRDDAEVSLARVRTKGFAPDPLPLVNAEPAAH